MTQHMDKGPTLPTIKKQDSSNNRWLGESLAQIVTRESENPILSQERYISRTRREEPVSVETEPLPLLEYGMNVMPSDARRLGVDMGVTSKESTLTMEDLGRIYRETFRAH